MVGAAATAWAVPECRRTRSGDIVVSPREARGPVNLMRAPLPRVEPDSPPMTAGKEVGREMEQARYYRSRGMSGAGWWASDGTAVADVGLAVVVVGREARSREAEAGEVVATVAVVVDFPIGGGRLRREVMLLGWWRCVVSAQILCWLVLGAFAPVASPVDDS